MNIQFNLDAKTLPAVVLEGVQKFVIPNNPSIAKDATDYISELPNVKAFSEESIKAFNGVVATNVYNCEDDFVIMEIVHKNVQLAEDEKADSFVNQNKTYRKVHKNFVECILNVEKAMRKRMTELNLIEVENMSNKQQLLDLIAKLQSAVEADTNDLSNLCKIHDQIMNLETAAFEIYKKQIDKEDEEFEKEMNIAKEEFEKEMEGLNTGKRFS